MTLSELKGKNPGIALFDVRSNEFAEYGRLIEGIETEEIIKVASAIEMPDAGSVYHASEPSFEALPIAREIRDRIFGTLDTELGYCCGHNSRLNGAEWHCSSELNIAVTDLVLILGRRQDLSPDGRLESASMKAFYLPAGTAAEIFATTLHFCPCEVERDGFGCVVGLPAGTNLTLDEPTGDRLLFRRNKWIIAHENNEALISKGVFPGIKGENLCVTC